MRHEISQKGGLSAAIPYILLLFAMTALCLPGKAAAHDYSYFIEDGCCRVWVDHCTPDGRAGHPTAACRDGHKIVDISSQCTLDNLGCCTTLCPGFVSYCTADIPTGSVQEIPNGIDDDCDGFIDDEQCDDFDNDGNGIADDSPGSCLLKILFVPLAWQGGVQSEFESAARTQWNAMRDSLHLNSCQDNFEHRYLNVLNDNIAEPGCNGNCGIGQMRSDFLARADAATLRREYDVIAFLTNRNICNDIAGCSDENQFVWVETDDDAVLAHEVGHIRALEDEYCSNRAGSTDERCNDGGIPLDYDGNGVVPPADLNILGSNLGCDPRNDEGCCGSSTFNWLGFGHSDCADVNYGVCCEGNRNYGDGRCIMSYANAENPRLFCDNCIQHLENDWFTRLVWNSTTNSTDIIDLPPISCSFKHQGSGPVTYLDYSLSEDGQLTLTSSFSGRGRLGLKAYQNEGRYGIEVRDYAGNLLFQAADDPSFGYDGPMRFGTDYGNIAFSSVARSISMPVADVETGPLKITALKDGVITSQTCLESAGTLGNGARGLAPDSSPPTIQCPNSITLECTEPYGISAGNPLLVSFLGSCHAADTCDPAPTLDNDAPAFFVLGTTPVMFTAKDVNNNAASCTADASITDTTPPVAVCPQDITVECSAHGGTPAADPQLAGFFEGFKPADTCDTALPLMNNAPSLFAVGSTTVTFSTADDSGNTASCQSVVTVVDTTQPGISVSFSPNVLWPPNHKMVSITPDVRVNDACDRAPSTVLSAITVSDGGGNVDPRNDTTSGDGHTLDDVQVDDGGGILLRAERSGPEGGRVYTITYTATDDAGNESTASSTVTVPHNK